MTLLPLFWLWGEVMYWSTGTLYSKRENRDYQKFALKLKTFSASLKLLYIDIRRLSFVERYATAKQTKRGLDDRLKWKTIFSDFFQSNVQARNIWYSNRKFRLISILLLLSLDARLLERERKKLSQLQIGACLLLDIDLLNQLSISCFSKWIQNSKQQTQECKTRPIR